MGEEFAQYLEWLAYLILGAVALYLVFNLFRYLFSRPKG